MNKKKKLITNNLWWLDYSILNSTKIKFKYYYHSNLFYIQLINYYYFFLISKKNLNNMLFSNLDATIQERNYYISVQTFFFDLKFFIEIKFKNYLFSLSSIYSGNTWTERELKESNEVFFINLADNRKLLSNYNYNDKIEYNQFNTMVGDIKI